MQSELGPAGNELQLRYVDAAGDADGEDGHVGVFQHCSIRKRAGIIYGRLSVGDQNGHSLGVRTRSEVEQRRCQGQPIGDVRRSANEADATDSPLETGYVIVSSQIELYVGGVGKSDESDVNGIFSDCIAADDRIDEIQHDLPVGEVEVFIVGVTTDASRTVQNEH